MLDLVTVGETMAVFSPEIPGLIRYHNSYHMRIAGAESNVAIILSKLGHKCGFITKLGDDEFGWRILYSLKAEGVDIAHVSLVHDMPTGIMFKQIDNISGTSVNYYRANSAASTMKTSDIDWEYVKNTKILHITGITAALSESCREMFFRLVDFAKKNSVLLSFDPNIRLKMWNIREIRKCLLPVLYKCNIVLIGQEEAKILLGTDLPDEIIEILHGKGIEKIAVKLGKDGAVVSDANHTIEIPPAIVSTVDATGAGDAFDAGFLCGVIENKDIRQCGMMGGLAGALAVSSYGDYEGIADRKHFDNLLSGSQVVLR